MSAPENGVPIRQMFGVEIPMRDGVKLAADIWLPAAKGRYPVIFERTPYIRTDPSANATARGAYFASRGYAYVIQDVRGRGDSGGAFNFFFTEGRDGYDSVEWLAVQSWSNGRVGTMGISYPGTVQWLTARERPRHLVCIAPSAPGGQYLNEVPYVGGAFMLQWVLLWLSITSGHIAQTNIAATDFAGVFAHRPLNTLDEAFGRKIRLYREFLEHDTMDSYWKRIQFTAKDFAKIDIPVLATTGWFDGDHAGTLLYWRGMHERRGGCSNEYLTIGPWDHHQSLAGGATKLGELELPSESIIDNMAMHLAFFEHFLKGATETFDQPKVRLFVTGANKWRHFDAYPPAARETRFYLKSGGKANTASGDGELVREAPKQGTPDRYTYDPKNPVPLGFVGQYPFATDRSEAQMREDILVYSTPPLDETVEIIGPVTLELYAASDAKDTDFTCGITDVFPDGRAVLLGAKPIGIQRARYRNGTGSKPVLLTPGKPELFRISMGEIGHAFQPGHRIRIEVSSSAYPTYNPNQNTGNPVATDTEWKIAHQEILHEAKYPSALVLPVVA